jgi:X-X-X-Leu-X-X-Gly heptad repeat protein
MEPLAGGLQQVAGGLQQVAGGLQQVAVAGAGGLEMPLLAWVC